jgi:hypothetical protein
VRNTFKQWSLLKKIVMVSVGVLGVFIVGGIASAIANPTPATTKKAAAAPVVHHAKAVAPSKTVATPPPTVPPTTAPPTTAPPTTSPPTTAPPTTSPPATSPPATSPPAAPGSNLTQQQQSAAEEAQQYLSTEAFSQQGLIDQLDSPDGSGYSVNDATVAVDGLTTNWNTEAVQAAKEYLNTEPFSCNDLIQQLDSPDGSEFTVAQATYGATQAGDC